LLFIGGGDDDDDDDEGVLNLHNTIADEKKSTIFSNP
jgi:hypothetical protein